MNTLQKLKLKSLQKKAKQFHETRQSTANPDIKGEIKNFYELAKFYDEHLYDKDVPNAEIYAFESYRAAAILGDVRAQFLCGKRLLEKGNFWDKLAQSRYSCQAHNKYAYEAYKEALSYLEEAENNGNMSAKRLRGLAFMRGWGLPKNYSFGFKLIVESIDQEQAWDRAKDIVEGIGLKSAEFFAELAAMKKKAE